MLLRCGATSTNCTKQRWLVVAQADSRLEVANISAFTISLPLASLHCSRRAMVALATVRCQPTLTAFVGALT